VRFDERGVDAGHAHGRDLRRHLHAVRHVELPLLQILQPRAQHIENLTFVNARRFTAGPETDDEVEDEWIEEEDSDEG
jgi:hypothetical protein